MAATTSEGTGTGSSEGPLRGYSLDNAHKILIGQQLNALKTCIQLIDGIPTLRVGAENTSFDDTGLTFVSSSDLQGAIEDLDAAIGTVTIPTCIQDADLDTSVCVSLVNDITVTLGDDGTYADNTNLITLNHAGCTFAGSPGTSDTDGGTGWTVAGGNGFGVGPTGQGGGFLLVTGNSGDAISSGAFLNITGANNNPQGGDVSLGGGNSTTGTPGAVLIGAGANTVTGSGGYCQIDGGGAASGTGGGVLINGGGVIGPGGDGGSIDFNGGTTFGVFGDGGAANFKSGSAFGTSGSGGLVTIEGGFSASSLGDGGSVNISSGFVSVGNPGDAGNVSLFGAIAFGGGAGGNIIFHPGGGAPAGSVWVDVRTDTLATELRFVVDGGSVPTGDYVGFKAPVSTTYVGVWTLPDIIGAANTHLTTNGAGILTWSNNKASTTFTNADLVANVFTFTHSLGVQYLSSIMVYDGSNFMQTLGNTGFPVEVVDANTVTVNFGGAIAGTYTIVVQI